jgi:hypothetical protein
METAGRHQQTGKMGPDDRFYYLGRAEEELERASAASHEAANRAHALLAGYYLDRAYRGKDEQPPEQPQYSA